MLAIQEQLQSAKKVDRLDTNALGYWRSDKVGL